MSTVEVRDPVWQAILSDKRLSRARRQLSFHELRLIINHVRSEIDEQLRVAGLIRTSQGIGCATCGDAGRVPDDLNWRAQDYEKCPTCTVKIDGNQIAQQPQVSRNSRKNDGGQ